MECEDARLAISAGLDGEDDGADRAGLESHLEACADCDQWREAAHRLTRRGRLQLAAVAPEPPAGLLAEARRQRPEHGRASGGPGRARAGLVAVALTQLALTVPALVMGHDRDAPVHLAREMGSFDVAVAVGFLVAAWRPRRAMGMLALVAVAAGLLVITATMDLTAGRTTFADEAPRLLVVAGWLLLRRVAAAAPTGGDRPVTASAVMGRVRLAFGRPVQGRVRPAATTAGRPDAAGIELDRDLPARRDAN